MIPYYITFFLSALFCYLGELSLKKKSFLNTGRTGKSSSPQNNKLKLRVGFIYKGYFSCYHLCFFLCILSVALLAGLRDYSVGTDIQSYGNSLFFYAYQYRPFTVYLDRFPHIEPLYLALVYMSSFLSNEPHILYFLTGALIYSFMLAGFIKLRKYFPITLSWICFLCLLYGDTFNAMRQTIAIAICFLGFNFLLKKEYTSLALSIVVAFMFHNTAIIFGIVIAIYLVLQKNNSILIKLALAIGSTVGLLMFNQILEGLISIGLLQNKMERYLIGTSSGISILAILIRLPFLVLILLEKKKFWRGNNVSKQICPLKNEAEGDFYIVMLFVEMLTVELSAFIGSLYRISLYFIPFRCLAYSRFCGIQKRTNRVLFTAILIIYLVIIFVYQNQIKGNNEIYPYIFGV